MMPLRGKQCKKEYNLFTLEKNEFFLLENLITFWEKGLFRNKGYTLWKRDFFLFFVFLKEGFYEMKRIIFFFNFFLKRK